MQQQKSAVWLVAASAVALFAMSTPAFARSVQSAKQTGSRDQHRSTARIRRLLALVDPATPRAQPDNYAAREKRLCQIEGDCITVRLR